MLGPLVTWCYEGEAAPQLDELLLESVEAFCHVVASGALQLLPQVTIPACVLCSRNRKDPPRHDPFGNMKARHVAYHLLDRKAA